MKEHDSNLALATLAIKAAPSPPPFPGTFDDVSVRVGFVSFLESKWSKIKASLVAFSR